MSAAGWRLPEMVTGSEEFRFGVMARLLAAEFPGYEFGICRMFDHIAIDARRHGPPSEPGLFAVVTNDVGELRRVLAEGQGSP